MPRTTWLALLVSTSILSAQSVVAFDDDPVEAVQAREEIPEDRLLDVGIHIFGTGLPESEEERYLLEEKGVFEEIRKSEARWIPMVMKRTLESTGFWGAVRLVPSAGNAHVLVDGTIVTSNGKKLEVDIVAFDSTGRSWLAKSYKQEADVLGYEEKSELEPFQSLYNRIANDLLEARSKLEAKDYEAIRQVTELKFASDLAPTAFEQYLAVKKGRYSVAKLPAESDPMVVRVGQIRDRDQMFIDTLNEHYADFHSKMEGPYDSWRSYSYEEQVALEKLTRASRWQKILGAAAIFGGVMASRKGGRGWGNAGEVAIIGGMMTVMDGFDKGEQTKMHREALKELAGSFDSEVSEILFDVEGEVLRLKGTVETQYTSWRQILRQIFATEMGLPLDPNIEPVTSGTKS